MSRPFIVAHGAYKASIAHDVGNYVDVPLPTHKVNDVLVVVCNYYPSPLAPTAPDAPAGWQAADPAAYDGDDRTVTNREVQIWWWRRASTSNTPSPRVVRPNPTGASDASTHLSACAFAIRGCVTFGDPFEGRAFAGPYPGRPVMPVAGPAVTSTHAEALAVQVITATHHGVSATSGSAQSYTLASAKYSYVGAGAACVVLSRSVEIGTIASGSTGYTLRDPLNGSNSGTVFGFVAIPAATVDVGVVPPTSVRVLGPGPRSKLPPRLGCARNYEAIITANDYVTAIDAVRFSKLSWDRVLDEPSSARVEIPDEFGGAGCIAKYGGVRPWRYGLTIQRDGLEIWRGPITRVSRNSTGIALEAQDAFARFKKRLATRSVSLRYVANDSGQMFSDLLNVHARTAFDAWEFKVPQVDSGVAVTRNVVAREFSYAWDIVEDLLNSAIDAYVLAGVPVVFQPNVGWVYVGPLDGQFSLNTEQAQGTTTGGDVVYGMFTREAFTEMPEWSINGMAQANTGWVMAADSGQSGFRKFWTAQIDDDIPYDGVLDHVETAQLYRPAETDQEPDDSAFQRRADSLVALRAISPAVIEGLSLSADAPVNVENLRPGSIWLLDVYDAGWGQLLSAGRVKRIAGEIQAGAEEKIGVTLQPLGYTESDL